MALTDTGAIAIASALLGDADIDVFNNTNAKLGVGDDNTAFAKTQTQLLAEATPGNSKRKGMDASYPDRDPDGDSSDNKVRYRATFTSAEGNFAWLEWGVFNHVTAGSGTMLCRVVENLGTKASGATWVLEVDITTSA